MAGDERDEDGDDKKASQTPDESEAKEPKADAAEAEAEAEPSETKAAEPQAGAEPDSDQPGEARAEPASAAEDVEHDDVAKDRKDIAEPAGGHRVPDRKAAAWGRPFARLDAGWTKFEARLCAVVLLLEVFALSLWVALKGLSTASGTGNSAGLVFRAIIGALVLGGGAALALRKKGKKWERTGAITGTVLGIVLAKVWANACVDWSSNLLNWYQQASFLTLLGGLRGVGTRLTLLLALLGGSLATAAGKHITIDLMTRFLKPKTRIPIMIAGWLGTAVICFSASWGFFDHIAIEDFGAKAEATAGAKFKSVGHGLGEDFFIARKQMRLDFSTLPHVLKGERYADWMTGAKWNEWLDQSGLADRYGKQAVDDLKMSDLEATRSPIVVVPDRGEPRGELIKAANLVFPLGLLIIALRFLLLCLLTASGHLVVDPEAHIEGSDIRSGEPKPDDSEKEAA
jgi:hypothetical protein